MPDPDALLAALDPEQRAVATTFGAPVAVIAGAGTGKTRAITHRIAYGCATGAYDPVAVLAVTFTTRAAGELRGRLRGLGFPRVQARTFHSAALRQSQYFWPKAMGHELPRVSDHRAGMIAEAAGRLLGQRAESGTLRDLLTEISWAKVSNVPPADYAELAGTEGREVSAVDATTVGRIYARYEQIKSDRGVIDFDDVLLCTVALLSDHDDVRAQVRRTYRHLVVDEYQDVSPLQQKLLELWLAERPDLCVVGDAAQTIHSFAGARSSYLTRFAVRHPDAEIIRLVRDYRSTTQVVELANRVLHSRGPAEGVRLVAQGGSGPQPRFTQATTEADEAAQVARWLAGLIADGVPPGELAVLYRIHAQSPAYEAALAKAGVPFSLRASEGFFQRPEVRAALIALRGQLGAPGDVLETVRGVLAGQGWTTEPPSGQGQARERWESWAALFQLAVDHVAEAPSATLAELLGELDERARAEHAPSGAGVTLSTLHAAKGLEWEGVALVGVQEGTLPFALAQSPEQVAEERRLLYVGITRARRHLWLSWASSRNGGGARRKASRFLDGIRPETEPARPVAEGGRKKRSKLSLTCRVCGGPLAAGAELKLGRHAGCPSSYDERTWELLREWRRQEAAAAGLPAFCVFTDATLMAIAEARPAEERDLLAIAGVGRSKAGKYAEAVFSILRAGSVVPAGQQLGQHAAEPGGDVQLGQHGDST